MSTVTAGVDERPSRRSAAAPKDGVRPDIQAMRAIAVSMVLVYHLWPNRLTGGFTGVDVFFLISGFLITSHLLSHPPTGLRDLLAFWSRRIRRLLPASLLVLFVTLIASRLVAPETQWGNTTRQVKAAALYFVNWRLADDSVDYLASQNAPTPVQHFWSLSVEEQFYFVWPIFILLLGFLALLLRRRAAPFFIGGLGIAVVASLWFSVHETKVEPARAYFVTPTRIWELGIGGLLAARAHPRVAGRQAQARRDRPATTGTRAARMGRAGHDRVDDVHLRRAHSVPELARRRPGARCRRRDRGMGTARWPGRRSGGCRCVPCSGSATSRTRSICGTGRSSCSSRS